MIERGSPGRKLFGLFSCSPKCGRIVHEFYGIIYANKENGKLESNKRMWLMKKSILVFWAIVCLLPIQRRFKNFK